MEYAFLESRVIYGISLFYSAPRIDCSKIDFSKHVGSGI